MSGYPRCTWPGCSVLGTFNGPDGEPRCGIHRKQDAQPTLLNND